MTDKKNLSSSPDTIGAAINQVLRAEHEAGQAIAVCQDEAREILQAAQQQAQRISARTDKRIIMCHMRAAATAAREIGAQETAQTAIPPGESARQPDTAILAGMAAALAEELTNHAPSSDNENQD